MTTKKLTPMQRKALAKASTPAAKNRAGRFAWKAGDAAAKTPTASTARPGKPGAVTTGKAAKNAATKPAARPAATIKSASTASMRRPAKPAVIPAVPVPKRRATKPTTRAKDDVSKLGPLSDAIGKAAERLRSVKPAAAEPAEHDAPRIETRIIVNGIPYPVDASSLERTLGAGRFQRESLVDSWSDAAWVGLLTYLKLPADPLDREVAAQPVKRLVQRLWYEAVKGGVPEERKAVFDARDEEKVEKYKADFAHVEGATAAKSERAKTSFAKARGGDTKYTPTAALKAKGLTLGGQQAPLLAFFKATNWAAASTDEATAGMLKHGLKTGTDPKRISSFYLSKWTTKMGLLTRA